MMGLAQLYKKYCLHGEAGKEAAEKVSWIKDKLLHIYYQNSIDDKWVPYVGKMDEYKSVFNFLIWFDFFIILSF